MTVQTTTDYYDPKEFIEGQKDCQLGLPAKQNASESYNAGYGCEYQLNEIMGNQYERLGE